MILFDPDHLDDPYPRYRHWREQQPIWFDAGNDSWVLSRHEDVLRVFKDHEAFSSSGLAEGPGERTASHMLRGFHHLWLEFEPA